MNEYIIGRNPKSRETERPNKWPAILVLVLIALFTVVQSVMVWNHFRFGYDDSIYIGMARYFSSFTAAGYFELIRPMVLPLILGAGDFIGFDLLIFSKVLAISTAAATIWFTFKLTESVSNGVSGLFAALIVTGTQSFFKHSHMVLTDVPSICLSIISFLLFLRKSFFWAGFMASLAFMTRFPQGVLIISFGWLFLHALVTSGDVRKTLRDAGRFTVAYVLPVAGFMMFNVLRYPGAGLKAPVLPLLRAQMVVINNGILLNQGNWTYYLQGIVAENIFYAVALIGLWLLIRSGQFNARKHGFPLLTIILFFVYFTRLDLKYIRYVIAFIPYLAMFAGIGLYQLGHQFRIPRIQFIFGLMLFTYGMFNVKLTAEPQPNGLSTAEAINDMGYRGRVITSTPYVIAYLENKMEPVLVPEHFFTIISGNRSNLVVYSPASFHIGAGDTQTLNVISRTEAELEASYEQVFDSGEVNYPIQLYRPKP